ncbi:putative reverse transcriptase domain-containing protein, partial [Tanacetum coccineum]
AIHGIPVPPRPDLSVIDGVDVESTDSSAECAIIDRVAYRVPLPGVESVCFDINLLSQVFSKKLRIVKCIPLRLQLGFAKLFRSALDKVLVFPGDILSWVQLLILPCCVLSTFVPSNRAQRHSSERERGVSLNISLELFLDGGIPWTDLAWWSVCKRKLGDGHFTAAIKVLTSSGVTPCTPDTLYDLEAKHPFAPPPTLSSPPLGGAASAVADDLLGSITGVVNLFLSGKCPSQLGEFIASAHLTPLVKLGGGLCPIAIGTMWRRLVSKVASSSVGDSISTYLQDFQFRVGVLGGCEAVLHSMNRLIEPKGNEVRLSMLLVDFKNAFNLVDRSVLLHETKAWCLSIAPWVEFCYSQPARLYYDDTILWSCQGVQQGDPLGPLLFSLALHPLVYTINQSCELTLQAWYLDDGTIVGDTLMVAKALDIIRSDGPGRGLFLNIDKTELFWPVEDPRGKVEGIFPINISRPLNGVKLLGGSVSLDADFCRDLTLKRVSKTISLMEAIHKLHDPQCELLLLRNCAGVAKLSYALRTCSLLSLMEVQVQHTLRHI